MWAAPRQTSVILPAKSSLKKAPARRENAYIPLPAKMSMLTKASIWDFSESFAPFPALKRYLSEAEYDMTI